MGSKTIRIEVKPRVATKPKLGVIARRYVPREVLGQGGIGEVLLAYDRQLERLVAVKHIRQRAGQAEARSALVLAEARRLAGLQHPNIVTVYDVLSHRGEVVMVMEYLDGKTLEDWKQPLSVPEFVEVARDGLDALSAAHSVGLLHLDLKSTNIMLSRLASGRRQVKLLDFGLAAMTGESLPPAEAAEVLMGSVYTVSPEQLDRRPPDARTDLYAFGCVLYFALARREPFQGVSVEGVLEAHRRHTFRPLIERRPDLPLSLCSWVERLMARQPEDRPSSARAALADLFALASLWENLTPHQPGAVPFVPEIPVQDAAALRAAVGRVVTVAGTVERVWENATGTIRLLNFRDIPHEAFAVVAPVGEDTDPALLERLAELVGADIRVTGRVATFHDNLEIVVRSPGQIQAPGRGWT